MQVKTLFAPILLARVAFAQGLPIRVASFNIRYDASSRESGEKPWWDLFCWISADRCRQPYVIDAIKSIGSNAPSGAVTVIGLQEVLDNQLSDIQNGLGSDWAHIGVGRDDGKKSGEYTPIFYQSDALRLLYEETKWLSTTPDQVSYGWGAGSRRIVTIAVFEHTASGKKFIHANTHLDNASSQARIEGIKVVVSKIQAVQATYGPLGISLTGDFNSDPNGDAYKTLAGTGFMDELYNLATPEQRIGPNQLTYTTFDTTKQGSRIDFVWLGPKDAKKYSVQRHEIQNNSVNGMLISDHRPVVGDVTLLS
ncbi:endonuclease/Exonuclease/phosphatase [Colletotrichum orchidophilum]|uniref:Endonuclease/Exonuclease/phosphatase n=1 Tax=Colletotrichum orchidophilum TaxID=1209926 RepID=A0A1G4BRA5_9PEZI|nr:endonuclease/Exonuclease/phosphatase [Colletotrichum orchidophilum]OHF03984.1 endonuclease/Exonuclease/phosphatase [Colletotrichum orchidophilum]